MEPSIFLSFTSYDSYMYSTNFSAYVSRLGIYTSEFYLTAQFWVSIHCWRQKRRI